MKARTWHLKTNTKVQSLTSIYTTETQEGWFLFFWWTGYTLGTVGSHHEQVISKRQSFGKVDTYTLLGIRQQNWLCIKMTNKRESLPSSTLKEIYIFKDFIYLFLERGKEGEREGEKHQCVVASQAPPTGDLAWNLGTCPDWELNWRPFGLQAGAQSTQPHQPGLKYFNKLYSFMLPS